MNAINKNKNLKLQIVVGASTLLEKYDVSNLSKKMDLKLMLKFIC